MPFINVKERRLFYTRQGKASPAPDILLLHGAGGSHLIWPAQLRHMRSNRVYTLDLPGHGRSSLPAADSIADYAAIVIDFVEAIGCQHLVIAGHSMGGAIAQAIGLCRPSFLAGLVLIGTGARLRVIDRLLSQVTEDFEGTVDFLVAHQWADSAPQDLVVQSTQLLQDNDPEVLRADFLACNSFDVMDQLYQIDVPTLVIVGGADEMTPEKYGQYLADHIAGARIITIPEAGHMVFLEKPAATAAAVEEFLREL